MRITENLNMGMAMYTYENVHAEVLNVYRGNGRSGDRHTRNRFTATESKYSLYLSN